MMKVQQRTGEGTAGDLSSIMRLENISCDTGSNSNPHLNKLSHYAGGFGRGGPLVGLRAGLKTGFHFQTLTEGRRRRRRRDCGAKSLISSDFMTLFEI